MATFLPIFISIIGLAVVLWSDAAKESKSPGVARISIWAAAVIVTLILPSAGLIWLTMEISARLLAPTSTDMAIFAEQIAWITAAFSAIYVLIWDVILRPKIDAWIIKIIPSPKYKK